MHSLTVHGDLSSTEIRDSISTEGTEPPDEASRRLAMLAWGEELAGTGSWEWEIGGRGGIRWSDNLFRLFGLEPGEITPSVDYVVTRTHPDDRERVRTQLEVASESGRLEPLEYRIVRSDGVVRLVQAVAGGTYGPPDAPGWLVGILRDVTESRRLKREVAGHIAIEETMAHWVSLEANGNELLAELCEALEFAAGMLSLRRDDGLTVHSCWSSLSETLAELEGLERPLADHGNPAIAVEAWHSRRPVVIASLAEAPPFRGRDLALEHGLRSAIAVPAVSGGKAFAALELYGRDPLEPSETLLRTLSGIGFGLGHVLALRRGELQPSSLTARERDVLQLAAQGLPRKAIAHQLSLSQSTVKTHFEHIYAKWGVFDRASAVARGLREGLIE